MPNAKMRALVLLLIAGTLGACIEPTDSTAGESPAVERVQAATQAAAALQDSELPRAIAIRDEVLATLGLRLHPGPDEVTLGDYAGATLIRDPSSHELVRDETAGGAPADGVRVTLYARTSSGSLLIPLSETGFVDYTYHEFAGSVESEMRVEIDGAEQLVASDATYYWVDHLGETRVSPQFSGTMGEDEVVFEFTLGIQEPSAEASQTFAQMNVGDVRINEFTLTRDVSTNEVQGGLYVQAVDDQASNAVQIQTQFDGVLGAVGLDGSVLVDITDEAGSYTHQFDLAGTVSSPSYSFTCCENPPGGLTNEVTAFLHAVLDNIAWIADMFDLPVDVP